MSNFSNFFILKKNIIQQFCHGRKITDPYDVIDLSTS